MAHLYLKNRTTVAKLDMRFLKFMEQSPNTSFKSESYINDNGARYSLPGDSGDVYCAS